MAVSCIRPAGNGGEIRRVCLSVGVITNGDPNSGLHTRNIDVAAAIPDVYKQLNVNNFALVPTYIVAVASANMGNNSGTFKGMEYDPEAGILTVQPTRISNNNTFDGGAVVDVYCFYRAKNADALPLPTYAFVFSHNGCGSAYGYLLVPGDSSLLNYASAQYNGNASFLIKRSFSGFVEQALPTTHSNVYIKLNGVTLQAGNTYNFNAGEYIQVYCNYGGGPYTAIVRLLGYR